MFTFRSVIVFGLILSLIHFEFIFMYGIKEWSSFFLSFLFNM